MRKYLDGNGLQHLWDRIAAAVELKQDKLTGQQGQIVGFDASGKAVAQFAESLGDTGTAATIQVGTVASGPSGSAPQVTNSGTASAAVFDFVIPKGDQGDQGPQGPKGDKGDIGPAGPPGPAGESSASPVTLNGIYTDSGLTRLKTLTQRTRNILPGSISSDTKITNGLKALADGMSRNVGDYTVQIAPVLTDTSGLYMLAVAYDKNLIAAWLPQPSGWKKTSSLDMENVSDSKLVVLEMTESTSTTYYPLSCAISSTLVVSEGINQAVRRSAAAMAYSHSESNSRLLVAGGVQGESTRLKDVKAYNASLVATSAPSLGTARTDMGAASFRGDGKVLFYGGAAGTACYDKVDCYTNGLVKSTATAAPTACRDAAGCSFDDAVLFCGGKNADKYIPNMVRYSSALVATNLSGLPDLKDPFGLGSSSDTVAGYEIRCLYNSRKNAVSIAAALMGYGQLIYFGSSGVISFAEISGYDTAISYKRGRMREFVNDKFLLLELRTPGGSTPGSLGTEYKYFCDNQTDVYAAGKVTRLDIPAGTRYKIDQIHSCEQTNVAGNKRIEYAGPVSGYIAFGGFTLSGAVPGIPLDLPAEAE